MKRLLDAAKGGRYGLRDYLMLLMTYHRGLSVCELILHKAQGYRPRHLSTLRPRL